MRVASLDWSSSSTGGGPTREEFAWRRPALGVRPPRKAPGDDALRECLDRCLGELPADGRLLILQYYGAEGRARIDTRKRLAEALGVSESALRNRAQRLRDTLERCITHCLASRGVGTPALPRDTKS